MVQLKGYLQALRRNWWLVALTGVVAAAVTLLISGLTQPVYQTRLQLLVVPNMTEFEGRDLIYSLDTLDQRSIVTTYVEVAESSLIRRIANDATGLAGDPAQEYQISALALPDANVIELNGRGPEPQTVTDLVNAAAAGTIAFVSQTYDIYRLEQLDTAPVPLSPISPTPWRDAGLALALGLVLGAVLAILREEFRAPLRDAWRDWRARDGDSSALRREYLEHQLEQLLPEEKRHLMLAVIQLEGVEELGLSRRASGTLMRRVVERLREELPGRDVVGRWDGGALAVIMRRVASVDEGYRRLERLQQTLAEAPIQVEPGGEPVELTPRLGAVISHEEDTPASLNERLASALAQAGENGNEPTLYRRQGAVRASREAPA